MRSRYSITVTFVPKRWYLPSSSSCSTHSVSVRNVVTGTSSRNASFCNPPESVTTPAEFITAATAALARLGNGGPNTLLLAADCRETRPGSSQEMLYGDAAAGVLVAGHGLLAPFVAAALGLLGFEATSWLAARLFGRPALGLGDAKLAALIAAAIDA